MHKRYIMSNFYKKYQYGRIPYSELIKENSFTNMHAIQNADG